MMEDNAEAVPTTVSRFRALTERAKTAAKNPLKVEPSVSAEAQLQINIEAAQSYINEEWAKVNPREKDTEAAQLKFKQRMLLEIPTKFGGVSYYTVLNRSLAPLRRFDSRRAPTDKHSDQIF